MSSTPRPGEYRASNGIFYSVAGTSEPLLLLHGLMAGGAMYEPLVELLKTDFLMVVPDLRGHGRSGDLPGPYDVAQLAADLDVVTREAGFSRGIVLGYSHGGAVAQQFARNHPDAVAKLILACTYACNVATLRESVEAWIFLTLLQLFSPGTLARMIVPRIKPGSADPTRLTDAQADWLSDIMGRNRSEPMRDAVRGLAEFDSRPWLGELRVPTLVVGGTNDAAVPQHHFDTLTRGIPGATGKLVQGAGHTLLWTHTAELAAIIREQKEGAAA